MRRLKQRGDTIVEVLIAIVVVSSVLIGAFVSAQRSTNITRQSEERAEALKVAESQVEQLRKAALSNQGSLFDPLASNQFCVDITGSRFALGAAFPASVSADNFSVYPANCQISYGGITYYVAVIRSGVTGAPSDIPVFVVHTRWDRAGGGGNEELTLAYRIYR